MYPWCDTVKTALSSVVLHPKQYSVLGGEEGTKGAARPLWGRMTKLRPIDSDGHELHVDNPSGLMPVFTLLTFGSFFFQETFFTWIAGHQSLLTFTLHHWPLLLSLLFLTMTFWSPDLAVWATCLFTQTFFWIPDSCVKLPTWESHVKFPLHLKLKFHAWPSSLLLPWWSLSQDMVPHFPWCSGQNPYSSFAQIHVWPISKSCYLSIIFHGSTPFSPSPPFSLLSRIAGALQHMPRPHTCCTAHTTRVDL